MVEDGQDVLAGLGGDQHEVVVVGEVKLAGRRLDLSQRKSSRSHLVCVWETT